MRKLALIALTACGVSYQVPSDHVTYHDASLPEIAPLDAPEDVMTPSWCQWLDCPSGFPKDFTCAVYCDYSQSGSLHTADPQCYTCADPAIVEACGYECIERR